MGVELIIIKTIIQIIFNTFLIKNMKQKRNEKLILY